MLADSSGNLLHSTAYNFPTSVSKWGSNSRSTG